MLDGGAGAKEAGTHYDNEKAFSPVASYRYRSPARKSEEPS